MSDQDGHQVLTYPQAVDALRSITGQIRRLEDELGVAIQAKADAEGAYRAQLGYRYRQHRDAGEGVSAAETLARAEVAPLSRDRDTADLEVRRVLEKLENRRGERASLNALVRWASRAGGGDE